MFAYCFVSIKSTCRLYGTDLLRCSLLSFCWRTKLRHDFALMLHESSDEPVDERPEPRAEPESFVVTISGIFVWSCNECRLIFMRFKYGIYSDFYAFCHIHRHRHTNAFKLLWLYAFSLRFQKEILGLDESWWALKRAFTRSLGRKLSTINIST